LKILEKINVYFLVIKKFGFILKIILKYYYYTKLGIGDGDWGLGIGDWPIPNPQSPIIMPWVRFSGKFIISVLIDAAFLAKNKNKDKKLNLFLKFFLNF
jgi:hypothetical protein